MKRRKRVNPVSAKRAEVDVQRRALVAEQLAQRPRCEAGPRIGALLRALDGPQAWRSSAPPPPAPPPPARTRQRGDRGPRALTWEGCQGRATELHEPLSRARAPGRETILDPANTVSTCGTCHRWIHDHPHDAERVGLLAPSPTPRPTRPTVLPADPPRGERSLRERVCRHGRRTDVVNRCSACGD